jgi:hypothetical protein
MTLVWSEGRRIKPRGGASPFNVERMTRLGEASQVFRQIFFKHTLNKRSLFFRRTQPCVRHAIRTTQMTCSVEMRSAIAIDFVMPLSQRRSANRLAATQEDRLHRRAKQVISEPAYRQPVDTWPTFEIDLSHEASRAQYARGSAQRVCKRSQDFDKAVDEFTPEASPDQSGPTCVP